MLEQEGKLGDILSTYLLEAEYVGKRRNRVGQYSVE